MEDPQLAADGSRFTRRLRLEPVGPVNAQDLWLVHNDDGVWPWYGNEKPGLEQERQRPESMGESWHLHGVHKWIAVKPAHDPGAARPWPSVKQPTVRTDRPSGTRARPLCVRGHRNVTVYSATR